MKDDSLNDTQMIPGGYCRKCNTVWAYPVKCNCDVSSVGINIKPLLAGSGNDSVLAREIWNEAIEAAARCVHDIPDAEAIRRLKK